MYLKVKHGTRYRAATRSEILDAAAAFAVAESRGTALSAPRDAVALCRSLCAGHENERFCVLWLDTRHRVLTAETLFTGTLDGAAVYPREIVKRALELNAGAVILTHNHPSGDCEPSEADRNITQRVQKALALVDVRLLDHLVVSPEQSVSLAERGWL